MLFVISSLICGLVAGVIARALISGPSPRGCLPTTLLGIAGSLVGGFLGYLILGKDLDEGALQPAGLLGSIFGAVLVLLVYRRRARS